MGAYVFDLAVIQFDPILGFTKNCLLIEIIGHLADTLENNWRIIVIFRRCLIVHLVQPNRENRREKFQGQSQSGQDGGNGQDWNAKVNSMEPTSHHQPVEVLISERLGLGRTPG